MRSGMGALLDTNVWVAMAVSNHEANAVSSQFLAQGEASSLLFCLQTKLSLARLLTTPAVLRGYNVRTPSNAEALAIIDDLEKDDRIGMAVEPEGLEAEWRRLALSASPSPKVWMDAYLAAFALVGNHELVTLDRGFTRFKGLSPTVLKA